MALQYTDIISQRETDHMYRPGMSRGLTSDGGMVGVAVLQPQVGNDNRVGESHRREGHHVTATPLRAWRKSTTKVNRRYT